MAQLRETAQETVKFWRDPALENLEMLRATYVTHTFSRHTHEGYAIGVIEQGIEEFTYQGATHQAPAGSIVVIHPGEVHTGHAANSDGWTYRMLYPDVSLMQKAAAEFTGRLTLQESAKQPIEVPYFPNPVMDDPQLAALLRQLHQTIEHSRSVLERESRFLWLFAQLIARYADVCPRFTPIGNEIQVVRQVQDYLKANYMHSITLEQLAQLAQLKPLRLLRLFQKHVGLPPHVYLVQTRVMNAKALLRSGVPLAQAAVDTGFTDQSHLNRHFKRLVGVTPKQYAIGCKNVQDLPEAVFLE
ncbi:AraC family transcriptional regulator [Leptolyngbya sp. FACHB-711]|uniref:AraC family transcriptional regulator n=1 Tax=unclassified Leptolyngbya TaxID=2650499 RepID=UPI001688981F|nr:AraC family transcriptional regulator [Leptolyngbya sp. FACHB-711]MBD1851943.1 AraC family transcriptional regulator [Cyanobacteria bacterium FACHB-502]MBD2027774.1 AraC family transcriptional regulator [Leptolyngbya sp. FACHB-711]